MQKLTDEFIEKQKNILLNEKARLEKEISHVDKFPNYGDTEDENTEEVEDYEVSKGQESQFIKMLDDVNKALHKIKTGEYGICENCEGKNYIDIKRLEIFPAATTCIKCESKNK